MKKERLTVMESRAKAWAESAKANGCGNVDIEWIKSATWGLCPRALWRGEKMAHASGCGYCKHSAVLAQVCQWLVPAESRGNVAALQGSGERSVADAMVAYGWKLEHVASGRTYDAWTVSRIG